MANLMLTPEGTKRLQDAVAYLRSIAEPVGPIHAAWDLIGTGEAMLQNGPQECWPYESAEDAISAICKASGI